jgi:hypothetical protein
MTHKAREITNGDREKMTRAERLPVCVEVISKRHVHGGALAKHCIPVGRPRREKIF